MQFKKGHLVVAGSIIVVLVGLAIFIHYYGDWLWFENLGFAQVFTTIIWAKVLTFIAFALVFGVFAGVNLYLARRYGPYPHTMRVVPPQGPVSAMELIFHGKHANQAWILAILCLS